MAAHIYYKQAVKMGCYHSQCQSVLPSIAVPENKKENENSKGVVEMEESRKDQLIGKDNYHVKIMNESAIKEPMLKIKPHKLPSLTVHPHIEEEKQKQLDGYTKVQLSLSKVQQGFESLDKFISSLIIKIKQSPQNYGLLETQIFRDIENSIEKNYYSESDKKQLISLLLKYMEQCHNRSDPRQKKDFQQFLETFGKSIFRLKNEIFFNNKRILKVMNYLSNSTEEYGCFLNLKFNLDIKQALQVARITRQLFSHDDRAFIFLAQYLYRSCLNLQKMGVTLVEIQSMLANTLKTIQKTFPAAPLLPDGEQLSQQKSYKLDQAKLSYKVLDLIKVEAKDRRQIMIQFILERAKQANHSKKQFEDLIEDTCRQKGSHLKIGVKVKDKDHHRAIDRVIEKMIKKTFTKYTLKDYQKSRPGQKLTLQGYLAQEDSQYISQMNEIYGKISEPILFKVSDMLRGKCLYQTVQEINDCAEKLKKRVENKNCTLVELDNRLKKNTSDVVFKILVNQTVTELQLPIEFNIAHNEFDHKVYEIIRSDFHSSFTMLKIMNEEIGDSLLPEVNSCFIQINKNNTHEQQEKKFDLSSTFKSLEGQLSSFLTLLQYHPKQQKIHNEQVKELYIQYLKVKAKCLYPLPQHQRNKIERNSMQYYYMHHDEEKMFEKYQKYLQFMKKSKNLSKQDQRQVSDTHIKIGAYMRRKGNLSQAIIYYEKGNISGQNLDKQDMLINRSGYMGLGLAYKSQGNYKEALKCYMMCLEIEEKYGMNETLQSTFSLNNIGSVYLSQGLYQQALKYYFRCLNLQEKNCGKGSIKSCTTLNNIGHLFCEDKKYSQALDYLSRCLQIQEKIKGKHAIQCWYTLNNIGYVYFKQSKYSEALEKYDQAFELVKKIKGEDIHLSLLFKNIGEVHLQQGRYELALEYYNKCLAIQQKLKGQQSIDCALTWNSVGLIYLSQQKFDEAQKYLIKSHEIREKIKGSDSIDCAISLNSIGELFRKKGKLNQALEFYRQSLKVIDAIKGIDSVDSAVILNNIGATYEMQKKYDEALQNYRKCLELYDKQKVHFSTDSATILNNIGVVCLAQNKNDEAMQSFTQSLSLIEKIKGKDSIESATHLTNIGGTYETQRKFAEARDYYSKSLQIYERIRGKEAIQCANPLFNIATSFRLERKYAESQQFYKKCLQIQEKVIGVQNISYANTLFNIGLLFKAQFKLEETSANLNKCLEIQHKIVGKQSKEYALTLATIGLAEAQNMRFPGCLKKLEEARAIFLKVQGKDSKSARDISLKIMYFTQGL